ncbi:hypothetical protein CDO73_10465 [Saccharibacillus sp. O23]|uniref:hypothetical protein n=1 Tax=Saccharibacillus sp. O23 TaxID=2009338 RepID=UPI000B4E3EEF|nr:hypothetical protein [Saccharibacillus sp. O23]OWR30340.1 hypothetical protein CDO73_10465 [Saccharibacillus sp. O23]
MRRNFKRERLQALAIAQRYEREANERERRERPANPFRLELCSLTGSPGEWFAGYNVYTHEGALLEGPLPMVIDEADGTIASLEEHIGKRFAGAARGEDA